MPRSRSNTAESLSSLGAGKPSAPIVTLGLGGLMKQQSGSSAAPLISLSNPNSRHRRVDSNNPKMAAAFTGMNIVNGGGGGLGDLEGPMSTTKALMVSIICPRRIGHQVVLSEEVAKEEEKAEENAESSSTSAPPPPPSLKKEQKSSNKKLNKSESRDSKEFDAADNASKDTSSTTASTAASKELSERSKSFADDQDDANPTTPTNINRKTASDTSNNNNNGNNSNGGSEDNKADATDEQSSANAGAETPRLGNKTRKQSIDTDDQSKAPMMPTLSMSEQQPPPLLETINETKPSKFETKSESSEKLLSQSSRSNLSDKSDTPRNDDDDTAVTASTADASVSSAQQPPTITKQDSAVGNKNNKNEEEEEEITPEEAAAVTQGERPDESEINMEELLRLTFDALLKEWHLLNVPTVAFVDHQKLPTDLVNPDTPSNPAYGQDEGNWISLQVMVRPSSLGIILDRLERIGVGIMCGTLSIIKLELCKTASPYAAIKEQEEQQQREAEDACSTVGSLTHADELSLAPSVKAPMEATAKGIEDSTEREKAEDAERIRNERMIEAARSEWKNAATRLRIEQVREQIVEQASFSFDFISLVTIASILAGVGLITNNTVVIVASMLVSPIMGPVLGLTFGSRIKDWPLVRQSLQNECLALLGCVVVGALVGVVAAFSPLAEDDWPTNEMEIRGELSGLLTGIAIAIPSGMGVCLGILGGNTGSLVGVAISASLLPPAVNSGVCWVYAAILHSGAVDSDSGNDAKDFAIIGAISFALTVVNILCIWVAGLVMFEIKEVAPTTEKSVFWARDIKVARELNANKNGEKPPPINMAAIRAGLKTAIRRKNRTDKAAANDKEGTLDDDEKSIVSVRIRPLPLRRELRRNPFGNQPIGSTWALTPPSQQNARTPSIDLWEEMPFHDAPDHGEDDHIRYVGLEDMGPLLGFDQDDDDNGDSYYYGVDPVAFAQRFGRGRYL